MVFTQKMKTVLLFVCLFGLAFGYSNSSSESSESSKSDSSDSSSEESQTVEPGVTETAEQLSYPRGDNYRSRRDLLLNLLKRDLKGKKRGSSSASDEDSTTHSADYSAVTKSTNTHSSESSEEHTNPTLQKVAFTPEPNTSEESSEERTTEFPIV
ncbi:uncharacterized protein LOC108706759 [Xenopus laevis]|uniref:Uncharacterized protein LOC108706759 n=2 Tax=Xenopus laevis TaxID=8355 RepID=A0A1L8HMF1_XENLA|nr:uncharacterized protein LOC108706759 [Xenopus laevis]OCT97258.1 hypothetical protein XELAEV_18009482mg [Xenopus laevis]